MFLFLCSHRQLFELSKLGMCIGQTLARAKNNAIWHYLACQHELLSLSYFEMAPVMVIWFVYVNIPTVLWMFFNKLVSCYFTYFNFNLFSIEDCLALALNSLGFFTYIHIKY